MSDGALFVDSKGASSKAQVVASLRDLKLFEYAMGRHQVSAKCHQSGIIAYKLTQKGREQGKDFSDTVYMSAVWTKRGGNGFVYSSRKALRNKCKPSKSGCDCNGGLFTRYK